MNKELQNWKNLQTGNLFTRQELQIFFSTGEHLINGEPIKKQKSSKSLIDRLGQLGKEDRLPNYKGTGNPVLYKSTPILPSTGTQKNANGYYSRISYKGKVIVLGNYKTMEKAHHIYMEARKLINSEK